MADIEQYLHSNQIEYVLHEHPAVYTCDEVEEHLGALSSLPCKNLFLRDQKKRRFILLILPSTSQLDLKVFGKEVGDKLSFGNAELLMDKLGLAPGAVSPFGLINDTQNEVEVYIDQAVYNADLVRFHPNRNTASLELTREMFHRFLETLIHKIEIIN
ncbi:MAG: prolyl-tRNA synthetase associated domain-containing protein [Bacteroidota bacterium]